MPNLGELILDDDYKFDGDYPIPQGYSIYLQVGGNALGEREDRSSDPPGSENEDKRHVEIVPMADDILAEFIDTSWDPTIICEDNEYRALVRKMVGMISIKDAIVLALSAGLVGESLTRTQIALMFGCSRENIRQRENRGAGRLRFAFLNCKELEGYWTMNSYKGQGAWPEDTKDTVSLADTTFTIDKCVPLDEQVQGIIDDRIERLERVRQTRTVNTLLQRLKASLDNHLDNGMKEDEAQDFLYETQLGSLGEASLIETYRKENNENWTTHETAEDGVVKLPVKTALEELIKSWQYKPLLLAHFLSNVDRLLRDTEQAYIW